jgi:carboxylesterase
MKDDKIFYFNDLYTGDNKPLLENSEPFFIENGKVGCLLCHGFTGTPYEMRGIGEFLAKNGITVLGPLLPGHGTTIDDMKKTTTINYFQEYSRAVSKLRKICNEIFVCGLSLGAVLTLKYASENEVNGIISINAPIKFNKFIGFFLRVIGPIFKRVAVRKSREERIEQQKYSIVCYNKYPIGPAVSLQKFVNQTKKNLVNIQSPILILQGLQDAKWIIKSSRIIYNEVSSNQKNLVFLESSHALTLGPKKEIVQKNVLDFIQRNSKIIENE